MTRRLASLVTLLVVMTAAVAACSSGDGGGQATVATAGGGSEGTAGGSDASLIPPSHTTNTATGPPNTDPLAAAEAPSATRCDGHGAEPPSSSGRHLELRVALGASLETGRVRWALVVTNQSDDAVTLVYPTRQDGDVVLRDETGQEAYRWSADQVFTQQGRCQVIGGRQQYRLELGGVPLDVAPGRYRLVASLAARPRVAPARVSVTVTDPGGG